MKKIVAGAVIAISVLFSGLSYADDPLEQNMESLAKNYRVFKDSKNQKDALKALTVMRSAAIDSKNFIPHDLDDDQEQNHDLVEKGYRAGLDQLVAEIDKVTVLVKQGKLSQAKVEAKTLLKIRDENHQKYK